jgi:hypothetical protein
MRGGKNGYIIRVDRRHFRRISDCYVGGIEVPYGNLCSWHRSSVLV